MTTRPLASADAGSQLDPVTGDAAGELPHPALRVPRRRPERVATLHPLPGGPFDVEGEQVGRTEVAHVMPAQLLEGAPNSLVLGDVTHLTRPAEDLGLAAEIITVGQRRDQAAPRISLEIQRLHSAWHASHVDLVSVEEDLHRAHPRPAI